MRGCTWHLSSQPVPASIPAPSKLYPRALSWVPLWVLQPSIHLSSKALPGVLALWLAGAIGAGPDTLPSSPCEIKLSVTAAMANCIVDTMLGDLTIAQYKLVSTRGCQHLGNGDVGCGSGYPSIA